MSVLRKKLSNYCNKEDLLVLKRKEHFMRFNQLHMTVIEPITERNNRNATNALEKYGTIIVSQVVTSLESLF